MNINGTLLGQIMFLLALIMGAVCYYLGRRKTQNPVIAGFLGGVLTLIPPLGFIYLAVLVLKKDIAPSATSVNL